jgi:hypothetical protein
MNAIKITVEKKIASVEGLPEIVCGNSGYTLSFAFDNEWSDEQNKVARFSFNKNNKKCFIDMPIENNTCQVPVLVGIALVRVGVYAGELKTTTGAKIKCIKSIICDDAEATEEGMQNLYEKVLENAISKEDLETEVFVGEDYAENKVYTANAINGVLKTFNEIIANLDERLGAIEEDYTQALSLIGGAE